MQNELNNYKKINERLWFDFWIMWKSLLINKILKINPDYGFAYYRLAEAHFYKNNNEEAEKNN